MSYSFRIRARTVSETHFKTWQKVADIAPMISVTCRSCGNDLEDPEDAVCMHCGLPLGSPRGAEPDVPEAARPEPDDDPVAAGEPAAPLAPPLSADSLWQLALWGALVVSIVAVGAIVATLLTATFRSPEPAPATGGASAVTTTTAPAPQETPTTPNFDPPLSGAATVADPEIDLLTRRHLDEGIVTFRVDGTFCDKEDGVLMARGVIHNFSMARQTFDYILTVELIRAWNGAQLGVLETSVGPVPPFESAEWSVELRTSGVSSIRCKVAEILATPVG